MESETKGKNDPLRNLRKYADLGHNKLHFIFSLIQERSSFQGKPATA